MENWFIIQRFYYRLSRAVHGHIDAKAGGSFLSMKVEPAHALVEKLVCSQGRDFE
jgi:hypothetical protein